MILIGSRAAKYHFPDFRDPKDWDYVTSAQELYAWLKLHLNEIIYQKFNYNETKLGIWLKDGNKYEFSIAQPNSSDQMILDLSDKIASPELLFLLKRSHIHRPIWWLKNIEDYHFLKPRIKETGKYVDLFNLRRLEINEKYKNKINLNVSNKDFFQRSEKSLKRYYEHDDLHKVTCYYEIPLYDTLKVDKNKAAISRKLFDKLAIEDKIRTVREECYAIALERKLIPALESGQETDEKAAFLYALERVSTTLTSGWFREFALENHFSIRNYDKEFLKEFLEAVFSGKIQRKHT